MKHPVDIIRAGLALTVQNTIRRNVLQNNLILYWVKCAVKMFAFEVNIIFREFRGFFISRNMPLFDIWHESARCNFQSWNLFLFFVFIFPRCLHFCVCCSWLLYWNNHKYCMCNPFILSSNCCLLTAFIKGLHRFSSCNRHIDIHVIINCLSWRFCYLQQIRNG